MHQEFEPPGELRDTIKCFWYDKRDFGALQSGFAVVPDGYAEIIFHFGGGCSISENALTPPLELQNATETNGVIGLPPFLDAANAQKFHLHFRGLGRVTIAELNHVVPPTLQARFPMRTALAIFDAFRARHDLRKELPVQVEVENIHRADSSVR